MEIVKFVSGYHLVRSHRDHLVGCNYAQGSLGENKSLGSHSNIGYIYIYIYIIFFYKSGDFYKNIL